MTLYGEGPSFDNNTDDLKDRKCSQDSGIALSYPSSSQVELGNNLRITICSNQGGRKYMEDRVHVEVVRRDDGSIDYTFLGVYDGHGGSEASEFCRRHLLRNIQEQTDFNSTDDDEFMECIRKGFLDTHHQMWAQVDSWARTASGYPSTAGTTASCAFIRRGKLYTGHVGDSAIFLTTRKGPDVHYRLTEDHKPDLPKERKRIERSGGTVQAKAFVHRVVWTRAMRGHIGPVRRSTPTESIPFLAVARSLGDFWSYCEETQEFAVSPHPDVNVVPLNPDHQAIILASDGLTNVMTAEGASAIIHDLEEDEEMSNLVYKEKGMQPNHARILMRRTLQNWKRFRADNVSVIVAMLDNESFDDEEEEKSESVSESAETMLEDVLDCSSTVEVSPLLSLDHVFTRTPQAMVRLSHSHTRLVPTLHVPLIYTGTLDFNFTSIPRVGAGYLSHDDERAWDDSSRSRLEYDPNIEDLYDCLGTEDRELRENKPPIVVERRVSMVVEAPVHVVKEVSISTWSEEERNEEKREEETEEEEEEKERPCTPPLVEQSPLVVVRSSSRSSMKRVSRLNLNANCTKLESRADYLSDTTTVPHSRDESGARDDSDIPPDPSPVSTKNTRTPSPLGSCKLTPPSHDSPPTTVTATSTSTTRRSTTIVLNEGIVTRSKSSTRTTTRSYSCYNSPHSSSFVSPHSRKRPHAANIATTSTTPLMNRVSLEDRETNENSCETEDSRAPCSYSAAPCTPLKGDSASPSRGLWRGMDSKEEEEERGEECESLYPDAEHSDDCIPPPPKKSPFFSFIRRIFGGSE